LRVQGSGFKLSDSGRRIQGTGCRVSDLGCRVQGAGDWMQEAECRTHAGGCRVKGLRVDEGAEGERVYRRQVGFVQRHVRARHDHKRRQSHHRSPTPPSLPYGSLSPLPSLRGWGMGCCVRVEEASLSVFGGKPRFPRSVEERERQHASKRARTLQQNTSIARAATCNDS